MRANLHRFESFLISPVVRYAINGLVATSAHFCVLHINLKILGFSSAGLANLVAAFFGIAISFVGSRYFVFKAHEQPISRQVLKFAGLYTVIALIHGGVMYFWSDILGWDYVISFMIATAVQVMISYWGNNLLVFK